MTAIHSEDTVGDLAARHPALLRLFEAARIDYCCGGKRTLAEACRENGLDLQEYCAALERAALAPTGEAIADPVSMSLSDLADHIEKTHHAYLREELPRLGMLSERVVAAHGADDSRLREVRESLHAFTAELAAHMMKEEQVLFPMIRRLDTSESLPVFHCGSIENPIRQMELEHHDAGDALERMRTLTDDYTPPEWACNTYRALLDGLARLERDMHRHVHKEDNVLFPRAIRRQAEFSERTPS